MRSENTKGETLVRCQMANDQVPATMCETEQGSRFCIGCTAPTRRCSNCHRQNGIADARKGWCEGCLKQAGQPVSAEKAPAVDVQLGSVLERLQKVHTANVGSSPTQVKSNSGKGEIKLSSAVNDLASLHRLLMENATQQDEGWEVKMPYRVLLTRARLLPEEVDQALNQLSKKAYVKGVAPWHVCLLLKTDGIEEIKAALESPRSAQFAPEKTVGKARRGRPPKAKDDRPAPLPAPSAPSKAMPLPSIAKEKTLTAPPPAAKTPMVMPLATTNSGPTYTDLFQNLVERAQATAEGKAVHGVVPMVQFRWRIGAAETIAILEKLVSDGHIEQRDGWRSVMLLKDSIEDATPLPVKGKASSTSGPRASSGSPRGGSASVSSGASIAIDASSVPEFDTLEAAIEHLERQHRTLCDLQTGVTQELSGIELCLKVLKEAKAHSATLDSIKQRLLEEAIVATNKLLAAFGR